MVKRGPTHAIDTRAVRTVLSDLPDDWLVRSLEERDYGIDLTIEMFDGDEPTGKIALVQVKGRKTAFDDDVSISFPVRTIEYALLFPEPFFVFHTSNESRETYFIWIQKYVSAKLNAETPDWRSQGKVVIRFPSENTLKVGRRKIEEIMARSAARIQAFEYLSAIDWLEEHWESLAGGQENLADACLRNLERMRRCDKFLAVYATLEQYRPDFAAAKDVLEALAIQLASAGGDNPEAERLIYEFDQHLENMKFTKKGFLDEDMSDEIAAEFADAPPY